MKLLLRHNASVAESAEFSLPLSLRLRGERTVVAHAVSQSVRESILLCNDAQSELRGAPEGFDWSPGRERRFSAARAEREEEEVFECCHLEAESVHQKIVCDTIS